MNFLSKAGLVLVALLLIYAATIRGMRAAHDFRQKQNQSQPQEEDGFVFFNKTFEEGKEPPAPSAVSIEPQVEGEAAKITNSAMVRPSFNGEGLQPSSGAIVKSSFDNIDSNFSKYYENPIMQAFNKDMTAAMNNASFQDFLTPDFQQKYLSDPKIQKILVKYSKDPAFMQLMQEMMNDSAYMQDAQRKIAGMAVNPVKK